MADDKKAAAPAPKTWHPVEIVVILFVLASVLAAIVNNASTYLSSNELSFFGIPLTNVKDFFFGQSLLFKFFSITISVGSLAGIVALSHLRGQVWIAERSKLFPYGDGSSAGTVSVPEVDNETKNAWKRIVAMSESTSESDWKVAIIEADIMLDDLLYKLHLPGDTIGDKLKAVEPSDFLTLDAAWEAHRARNDIAHGNNSLGTTQREVRRIISLYEKVFKEFYLV